MWSLAAAKKAGFWPDGVRVGRGHGQPYLQKQYADAIVSGKKTVEGRPGNGWASAAREGDWVTFKVTGGGGGRLIVCVVWVTRFSSFEEMLRVCGVNNCLPNVRDVSEGARVYRAFGTFQGATYAELECEHGAVAMGVRVVSA